MGAMGTLLCLAEPMAPLLGRYALERLRWGVGVPLLFPSISSRMAPLILRLDYKTLNTLGVEESSSPRIFRFVVLG